LSTEIDLEQLERLKQKCKDGTLSESEEKQLLGSIYLQEKAEEKKIRDALLDAIHVNILKNLDKMK